MPMPLTFFSARFLMEPARPGFTTVFIESFLPRDCGWLLQAPSSVAVYSAGFVHTICGQVALFDARDALLLKVSAGSVGLLEKQARQDAPQQKTNPLEPKLQRIRVDGLMACLPGQMTRAAASSACAAA
jgi:hypothetical protein